MRDLIPIVDIPVWALLTTPAMLLLFVGILVWVLRRDRVAIYDKTEKLPLEDEE